MQSDSNLFFCFDLGSAFVNLSTYLTSVDKLALASTCKLMRQVIMRGNIWQSFKVDDTTIRTNWDSYLCWIEKYLPIIEPLELIIVLLEEEHEMDKRLLRALLQPKPSVVALSIRCNSHYVHLALANSCKNSSKLTLHSPNITDELAECMIKHMGKLTHL